MKEDDIVELSTIDIIDIAQDYFGKKLTPIEASAIYEKLDENEDIDLALSEAMKEENKSNGIRVAYDVLISKIRKHNYL